MHRKHINFEQVSWSLFYLEVIELVNLQQHFLTIMIKINSV